MQTEPVTTKLQREKRTEHLMFRSLISETLHVAVTTDRSFVIYLKNLDIEKEFDLYLKVLGSDGRTSNLKKLKLNYRGTRPKYDVTPTPAYTPKVYNSRDSVLRGLESPLKFTPNTFYEFTVIGAGTTNTNPGPGDVSGCLFTGVQPLIRHIVRCIQHGRSVLPRESNKAATYNLYVFFAKYTYTGGQWQETDRIESVRYQFRSAAITTVKLTTPGLSGTSNSPAGIVFKWKKAANASGYKIYRRTGNSSKSGQYRYRKRKQYAGLYRRISKSRNHVYLYSPCIQGLCFKCL